MTPQMRAEIMSRAKKQAIAFASAVRSRSPHHVQRIISLLSPGELAALAITLAAAADPARLKVITEETDDGMPAHITTGKGQRSAAA